MQSSPPQSPPVFRDAFASERAHEDDLEMYPSAEAFGGVQASQSRCDSLRGPARSLCYAGLYGVSI